MAEAQPSGPSKHNPDAADFIPRERPSTNSGWRSNVNRNWNRQTPPYQSQPPRETNHENPAQKLRTSLSKTSEICQQGSTDTSSGKPLKNHSFQNQRWQRSRSERSHTRRQPLSDASVRPSFGGGTPLGDWRIRTREPSDLCSSESEKEVGSADSRGAKPKRLTHVSGGSLRGPRDRIRHSYDREKRLPPKQRGEDMFENIPPRDAKSVSSKEVVFKTRLERYDGVVGSEEKQRHPCSSKKTQHESLDWNKPQDGKVVKPIEPHGSKTPRHENTLVATFASKDKKTDRVKESRLTNTCQEPKHHSLWGTDGDKYLGRKHQSQTQDNMPKKSMQQGWNRPWNKKEVPKTKETHTGSLIEQLTAEIYECMVCCEVVRFMAPVWSCQSCYHVFHLNCIKKWARSPASQAEDGNSGWRCPACQNVSSRAPSSYICFCGKVNNPEWNRNEIPHSCGELCRKKRSGLDCPHPCNILCHPGPCPSCPAFVTKSCQCGRTSQSVRCGQSTTFHCTNVCGNLLNCGEHSCTHVCHAGKCQSCQQIVHQACYCGGSSRDVPCGTDKDNYDGFGNFSCQKHCGKKLNCGKHGCTEVCHPQPCQPCPRLPQIVRFCPCGQTLLSKLLDLGCIDRKICTDPIPSCGKTCGKPLQCGSHDFIHTCESLCHEGDCGPCSRTSNISCRCSFKTKEVPCSLLQNEGDFTFMCDKRCNKKRQCGRHKCNEICCVDNEHKCSLVCGHKLNCGLHRCDEPCHRGNCQNCWQTSFDELTCYCGEAVIFPPVHCGTRPPECKKPCTRQHECDHPVFHSCHSEKKCPPCTYLTQKWCMGKHEIRNNIPCHLTDISCGLRCNQLLKCGMHKCKRICHKGECLINEDCKQPCALQRLDCGHPCMAPCHPAQPCPPSVCNAKVELQCECGRRKESVVCSVASSAYQRITAITMATKLTEMQLGDSVDIGRFVTKKEIKQTRLQCDEECMALERNRRLAEALNISENSDPFNTRSGSKYTDSLKEDARKDLKFVSEIEREIKALVDAVNKGKQTKKSHCFPPMNRDHRKLIHDLAELYCVESVSYDSEPKRNVVITAIKGKSMCPNVALMTVLEREIQTRPPPPIAHYRHQTERSNGNNVRRLSRDEPSIDYFDVQD